MALILFQRSGEAVVTFYRSVVFFFLFLGHFFATLLSKPWKIAWWSGFVNALRAGATLVFPLIIVSMLMGLSLAFSIHYMLASFNLQNQAMLIAQNAVIHDFVPLTIGFVLCAQCGLNLIDFYHPDLHQKPQKVLYETIIPLVAAINITAFLLYAYISLAFLTSVYFTFYYLLQINTDEYLLRLSSSINFGDLSTSVIKTILYSTIASFTAGYYYYDVAKRILPTRKAVSRIITRGLFWLICTSVFLKVYLS